MPSTHEDSLARSRATATDEERIVLALESIADQLRLLATRLAPAEVSSGPDQGTGKKDDVSAEGAWENEGGSLDAPSFATLGIKHSVIDQFEVGGYRYTNLADAIAQATRPPAGLDS